LWTPLREAHSSQRLGEPSFGNYDVGGAVAVNVNRYVGIEGEVGGAVGISQDLKFAGAVILNVVR
jgi:hypothetical protein